jgi:hypothetical protein
LSEFSDYVRRFSFLVSSSMLLAIPTSLWPSNLRAVLDNNKSSFCHTDPLLKTILVFPLDLFNASYFGEPTSDCPGFMAVWTSWPWLRYQDDRPRFSWAHSCSPTNL